MSVNTFCDVTRLPLGRTGFSDIRRTGKIYVDKTALIARIARQDTPLFLSRPRRFGKSLLVNTLHSLFARGLRDFKGLAIEKEWSDTTYPVVHLDFSGMADSDPEELAYLLCSELIDQFCNEGIVPPLHTDTKLSLPNEILKKIGRKLQDSSVVLLIDEYDAPLTHHIESPNELQAIIRILNNFYAVIKEYTSRFRFIFITGVTRTSHISIFSSFNNLEDVSYKKEYNTVLGFTKEDVVYCFDDYVDNSARALGMSKKSVYTRLEQFYDGFQFSINAEETLYNPWSILNFLKNPEEGFQNYWYQSGGTPSIIMQYLKVRDGFDFLNYQNREKYITLDKVICKYEITNIPIEILLCQAGYFCIRKETYNIARITTPNEEVEESLLELYFTANNIKISLEVEYRIDLLEKDIDSKNLLSIIKTFNDIINDGVSSNSNIFNDERSVRDIIYTAIHRTTRLGKSKERETVKGRSDLELITLKTHMVIEFKRTYPKSEKNVEPRDAEASLAEAIKQIETHHYGETPFSVQKLFRVAMVISTEEKRILSDFCRIV